MPVSLVAVLVLAGIVYGAIALSGPLSKAISKGIDEAFNRGDSADQAQTTGAPGSPTAKEPVECPEQCFSSETIPAIVPPKEAIDLLGTTNTTYPYGYYEPLSAGEEADYYWSLWVEGKGSPDACYFTNTFAPVETDAAVREPHFADQIYLLGTYEDDYSNTLYSSARLFKTSDLAEDYMKRLDKAVAGCKQYTIEYQSETETDADAETETDTGTGLLYRANVYPVPDLGVPASMAGIGWIERSTNGFLYYTVSLQRGNLIVQTTLSSDYSINEASFRRFLVGYAEQLAALPIG